MDELKVRTQQGGFWLYEIFEDTKGDKVGLEMTDYDNYTLGTIPAQEVARIHAWLTEWLAKN